jgi:hypothetical protein
MLYESLLFLEGQLNKYFGKLNEENESIGSSPVKLENIAALKDDALESAENIFVTLVNISEETTLKNVPNYRRENAMTVYENPPVYLNLYILFTACIHGAYDKSLMHLSYLIKFFQATSTFTHKNSPTAAFGEGVAFKLIMDLYSPTFEQANYLWSTLGGKQYPFALYKMRLLEMEKDSITEKRGLITEITLTDQSTL